MFIIEVIKAILFGIVEGVTEWLPISSTGHLILIQDFIQFKDQNPAFMEMFNVVIQLGAIMAVVVIYFDKLYPFKPGKSKKEVRRTWQLWAKVAVATLPLLFVFKLDDWFEAHFHNSFSVLSLFPGTSRSGATIVGGLVNGVSRSVVTEFTFYLGIPAMFGASLLKVAKFVLGGNTLSFSQGTILLVAMAVAFGVSMVAIRFLTDYVKTHDFTVFGKYRIVLGAILLVYAVIKIFI